ncbi:MAG: tRNA preQ1(34) S-adenosylmethionine ribosyltransferase-isomerase QueA [Clostridiales Family XIII bacterium]|jgi:S-adenosylmethionine:tRNA ribosyltransferase-isomerase|nr:tRNA preQ1(34) S-adenosylmethionine ribosyltransferase-isomerase QueA [Clostridiales Family XIII bacterium]
MNINLFDYFLPESAIAQYPTEKRDASRLLVVHRETNHTEDRLFSDLPGYLNQGDVLVVNDSRVIKARLIGTKEGTGARVELFLLARASGHAGSESYASGPETHASDGDLWTCLARPGKRFKPGDRVLFGDVLSAVLVSKEEDGTVLVRFEYTGIFLEILDHLGRMPLPPYIRREADATDEDRYQTIYASNPGSVAAPTAGLHFTPELLEVLRKKGVEIVFVTLHVGLGTFRPVQAEDIEAHHMHREQYHISEEAAASINLAKAEKRRVICVGTTSVRTIESAVVAAQTCATVSDVPKIKAGFGSTDIFLYPGGPNFQMTDALITNFHLPKSTLLMLVSAFYDREKILNIYREAIEKEYRVFSYGDAMLIL